MDFEEALGKELDMVTLGTLMQTPQMPSDVLFRENVRKDMMKIYDVA